MPTYSYVCKDCAHAFDIQQAFTDDALTTCPECAGVLRKVFSAVGVVFKGSGFYRTDSRGSGSSSGSSGEKAAAAASTSTSETGSAKPAESSAAKPASKSATSSTAPASTSSSSTTSS
ncbi:FmdB family transcriptional regulator [Ornithinimicrobium pratense]|uniref:FmdB family transcriptional regulator n=1 Tax=Ornithinimicrobium pratense TaxID=2593973 RepID=A0A5J6V205_9MICO|nr:FmdB family zinc ribbon protein [Ornithinimicrobium pratense]QFG67705.1 FmdB family transcriptional regulator [Ornithinimicrobium pratense]